MILWQLMSLQFLANAESGIISAECSGVASENNISATCISQAINNGCTVNMFLDSELVLNSNILTGTGSWSLSSDCVLPFPSNGEAFIFTGVRKNAIPGEQCDLPTSSLMQKSMTHIIRHFVEIIK